MVLLRLVICSTTGISGLGLVPIGLGWVPTRLGRIPTGLGLVSIAPAGILVSGRGQPRGLVIQVLVVIVVIVIIVVIVVIVIVVVVIIISIVQLLDVVKVGLGFAGVPAAVLRLGVTALACSILWPLGGGVEAGLGLGVSGVGGAVSVGGGGQGRLFVGVERPRGGAGVVCPRGGAGVESSRSGAGVVRSGGSAGVVRGEQWGEGRGRGLVVAGDGGWGLVVEDGGHDGGC